MNVNKNIFLIGAVIAIGIFVLPSTLSMFAGQHSWYNPEDVACAKCHFLEAQELGTGPHSSTYIARNTTPYSGVYDWGATIEDRCNLCHQSSDANFDNTTQHAAIAVLCIDCHDWVPGELTGTNAAHADFYTDLNDGVQQPLRESNKACIGCHTHVGVNISWTRAAYVGYDVSVNGTGGYDVTWDNTVYGSNGTIDGQVSEY